MTFFLYLYHWIPRTGHPKPVFEDIASAFIDGSALSQAMIAIAVTGIAVFTWLRFRLLVWLPGALQGLVTTGLFTRFELAYRFMKESALALLFLTTCLLFGLQRQHLSDQLPHGMLLHASCSGE